MSLEARFWAKVDRGGPGDCWLWQGATITAGYGHLRRGSRTEGTVYAHVLAVILDGRQPQPGQEVHHRCETPLCVNPSHLDVLSPADHGLRHRGRPSPTKGQRSLTCHRGHSRDEAYVRKDTGAVVYCRACRREDYAALPADELERRREPARARASAAYARKTAA